MIKSWNFGNYWGTEIDPETQASEAGADITWNPNTNRISVEGVFKTGDDSHQVVPKKVYWDNGVEIVIGIERFDTDAVLDISRTVPYSVEVEVNETPDSVTVAHEKGSKKTVKARLDALREK